LYLLCLGAADVRSAQIDLHAQPEEISVRLQMPHPALIKMVSCWKHLEHSV